MSYLTIYPETSATPKNEYSDFSEIQKALAQHGVVFERWKATEQVSAEATPEEVTRAYQADIDRFKAERGFMTHDVVSIHPGVENHPEMRQKFLQEHTHSEDEARFFVDGSGMFYIHHVGKIFKILCEKGDFLNVPAGTKHWFDMGNKPFFKAIRLFNNPEGWIASFTGDSIADRFPKYEQS